MNRKASAVWQGGLKDGRGTVSTESGVLSDAAYSFRTRFENEKGTNPEELVGAAHAGCFSMALSAQLGEAGLKPERIKTAATVTLEKVGKIREPLSRIVDRRLSPAIRVSLLRGSARWPPSGVWKRALCTTGWGSF